MSDTDAELDVSGAEPAAEPAAAEPAAEPPKARRARRTSGAKATDAKSAELIEAVREGMTEIAEALADRSPDLSEILKRDAPQMGKVVAHHARKSQALRVAVLRLFGPGSIIAALRAFGPSVRYGYAAFHEWRLERAEAGALAERERLLEAGYVEQPDGSWLAPSEIPS